MLALEMGGIFQTQQCPEVLPGPGIRKALPFCGLSAAFHVNLALLLPSALNV